MTVYVDDMRAQYGRLVMCHMLADSDEDLHAMADAIGVSRRWWQAPPAHASHYDICLSKRARAVALGAVQVTQREAAIMNRIRRQTGVMGTLEAAQDFLALRRNKPSSADVPAQQDSLF